MSAGLLPEQAANAANSVAAIKWRVVMSRKESTVTLVMLTLVMRAARNLFGHEPHRFSVILPNPRPPGAVTSSDSRRLEPEVHAEGQRNVVGGLAIQVERRRFLEVELA